MGSLTSRIMRPRPSHSARGSMRCPAMRKRKD